MTLFNIFIFPPETPSRNEKGVGEKKKIWKQFHIRKWKKENLDTSATIVKLTNSIQTFTQINNLAICRISLHISPGFRSETVEWINREGMLIVKIDGGRFTEILHTDRLTHRELSCHFRWVWFWCSRENFFYFSRLVGGRKILDLGQYRTKRIISRDMGKGSYSVHTLLVRTDCRIILYFDGPKANIDYVVHHKVRQK